MELLDLLRLGVALVICLLASYSDWKTRVAKDGYWLVMGVVGLTLIAIELALANANWLYFLFLFPIGFVFVDLFWDRKGMLEDGINPVPIVLYALGIATLACLFVNLKDEVLFWRLAAVLVMFAIIFLLYQLDIIKGGADAKALMALSVLFPAYPIIDGLPLIHITSDLATVVFPFSLLVLFNAALLSIAVPLGLLFYNASKKEVRLPAMLLGYRTTIQDARGKFVWSMERMVNGERKFVYFPKEDEEENAILDALQQAGVNEIWVTPKIPFLIPITVSIIFSAVVGNIVMLLIH
jgi:preflagellin peptidase FlaK